MTRRVRAFTEASRSATAAKRSTGQRRDGSLAPGCTTTSGASPRSAGSSALAYLPLAVLGGVMLTVAWGLVDVWTKGLVRRLVTGDRERTLLWSAAVVVLVAAITVLVNFVIA